jgi:hypothetical protein
VKQAPIRITFRLCLKWTLLVSLSAVASFVAALLSAHNSAAHIAAMIAGIITFIAIYVAIDGWAIANLKTEFQKSLRIGVLVKIGLELIPAIEIFTGLLTVTAVEALHIQSTFLATYLKTMATGAILSLAVGLIASLYWYYRNRLRGVAQNEVGGHG